MGQDINSIGFSQEDINLFKRKLEAETLLLKSWFDNDEFDKSQAQIGIELEAWLVDKNTLPNPIGVEFLNKLNHKQVVPEISRFNFEINSTPYPFTKKAFSDLSTEMTSIWNRCAEEAESLNSDALLMGTLATLRADMLSMEYLSPNNRYSVMNKQVMDYRQGKPLNIRLEGKDEIELEMDSVIAECAATSLQIHLGVTQENAKRYYNASLIASCFTVAVSANSPYFFGKELWDESRIATFEQSVEMESKKSDSFEIIKRVTLGSNYIKESLFELFEENINDYPILLPERNEEVSQKSLHHLNLHNGTIWRWTRPIVGDSSNGQKHLRIEQRTPSAGPTIDDSIANSVFFLGLCDFLATMPTPPEDLLSFKDCKENFYLAAKQSFYSRPVWLDGKKKDIIKILNEDLLPGIKECLVKRGISKKDIEYYIDFIIQGRIDSGVNGARWQKAWIHKNGKKFQELMEVYIDNQKSGKPVHLWKI